MNAKDLRTEAALGDRSNDGNTKYAQGGGALPYHRNKTYQDIGSNSLAKVDAPPSRPCAVIGPDRVVPPPAPADYHKKGPPEPWLTPDSAYRRPPEYPHKLLDYQHPSRNISPRQTFQENMQRIMVPPSYNTVKLKEDHNFLGDSNITQMKNHKFNVPTDSNTKYCDVPYTVTPVTNEQKNVRNSDVSVLNMNSVLARGAPHCWPPNSANIQPPKPFHQDLCQYPEYQNCAAPRPMAMTRPHRPVHEEPGPVYPDSYYQHGNIRFKPYPSVKDRYPQTRYEYIGNYSNPFHPPPPFATHKYDIQKPLPPHPYPNYPQVPLKYLDSRMGEPIMNGYQRSLNQQPAYSNVPYRNQVIHPTYGPVPGNCLPSGKYYSYPPEAAKSMVSNKIPYDANGKVYPDYESNRIKNYPTSDALYVTDIGRSHPAKGPVLPPNYPTNIHAIPAHSAHPYYRKEPLKGYEYSPHIRNMDHMLGVNGNLMSRFSSQFSPSAIAISPSDSNTSIDTIQTQGICQEDCGYVSQSSTASIRSMDSIINRMPPDVYRRYDYRYGNIIKGSAAFTKLEHCARGNVGSKDKKDIDVRQFLQMWNEGEDEGGENNNKEVNIKNVANNGNSISAANYETADQEQLYVLGLVNVPSEELDKYEHIQKVSKLPENIKGYNSIELLHQFEEVVESSNLNHYNTKSPNSKQFYDQLQSTVPMHGTGITSRPMSPLDVEAKISQSVIHKEVGCNFEIKPCSPKMLNVEVATPVQTVMGERIIEKVSNSLVNQPRILHNVKESRDNCNVVKSHLSIHDNTKNASCKMVHKSYGNKDPVDPVKTNYSIQDLESNSGVCLASLPRLDNDIELNFPEVNQQFINANKAESVITSAPNKDLPPLDVDQTHTTNFEVDTDNSNPASKRNSEKDFTKLSKYRKLKRKNSGPETNVQALRTDSVIIKNPENCKHENLERALSPKTIPKQAQEDPINLSVNTENRLNTGTLNMDFNKTVDVRGNEIAIDFSMNSNEAGNASNMNIKKSEIIFTNNDDFNDSNIESQDMYKSVQDHAIISVTTSIQKDQKISKALETKCNLNTQAACKKELLDITCSDDIIISLPESKLPEHLQANSEAYLSHVEKYDIASDKDILNKKLLSYNLLSSQEKEDTLNEKMRELFGEEFSTVDAEPEFEQLHDTQAILDDNSVDGIGKNYVFSDESSQSNDTHETCTMPSDFEKVIQDSNTCNKEPREQTKQNWDVVSKDALLSESFYKKSDFKHRDVESFNNLKAVPDEAKTDEQVILSDINSCLIQLKSEEPMKIKPKTDVCRVSKELLSPWIQKLIANCEGSCSVATTNSLGVENYDMDKNNTSDTKLLETEKYDKSCVKVEHYACAGMNKRYDSKKIESSDGYLCSESTIVACENIENNEKRNRISNKAIVCKKDDNLNNTNNASETSEKCTKNLEMENNSTSSDIVKDDTCKVLEIIDKHKIGQSLKNDKSIIKVIEADDCDKSYKIETCRVLETIDKHKIANSMENYKSNNEEVMEAYDCDNNCKIDTCNVLETNDKHDITNIPSNSESNNKVMEADDCDKSYKSGTCKVLETIEEHKIANNLENDKTNNEAYDCDNNCKIDTCKVLETIDKHEIANSLANNKSNDKVIEANDCDKSCKIETCKVLETIVEHEISNSLENDESNNEAIQADNCDNSCENEDANTLTTVHTKDILKNDNKLQNVNRTNDMEMVNENQSIENVNDATNTNTKDDKFNGIKCNNILESKILVMSSSNKNCEEVANDIEHILDTANHETEEYFLTNNQSTEIFKNVACFTEKKNKTTYNCANLKVKNVDKKRSDDVVNEFYCKKYREMAQSDNSNEAFDIDTENTMKTIHFECNIDEENLQANKEIVLSDKNLDELNCQNNFSRWSLNQTPEHTGILSPLTPDADSTDSETTCGNEHETGFVSEEDNENGVQPITDKDCIDAIKNNNQQYKYESKISDEMETFKNSITEIKMNAEFIPITVKKTISGHNLEASMGMQEELLINDLKSTKNFKPTTNAAECNSHTKLNKTRNTYFENNPSNTSPPSSNKETGHIIEESTSCSDVSDETSASDDDNSSESEESIVFQNNKEFNKPISDFVRGVVGKVEVNQKNQFVSIQADDLFFDKLANNNLQNKSGDSTEQIDKTNYYLNTDPDKYLTTSEVQDQVQDTECSNFDNTDCEQDNVIDDIISEPILSHPCQLEISVENMSMLKDCVNNQVDDQYEVINDVVKDTHDVDTNFVHVSENVMDNSGSVLEASQEHANFELLEDTSPNDIPLHDNSKNVPYSNSYLAKRRKSLKRSLSDSALDDIRDNFNEDPPENSALLYPTKRKKNNEFTNYNTSRFIAENICQVLQSNRRNSVSSIHNEGNVSFCILIDNNCIISDECDESAEICFSEVPEDCLPSIQEESLNQEDCADNITLLQRDNDCDYSTKIETNLFGGNKSMVDTWVDDVACVETVVSDDIAENIVISASTSPKDDEYNDDETEVYDINEHTEKLKFIYGDKMYNDDTHFVQTLYRTPQMNVNKTLNHRESNITDDSQTDDDSRYYDRESLERVLSESNVQDESDSKFISVPHSTPSANSPVSEIATDDNENLQPVSCPFNGSESPQFKNEEHVIDGMACHDEKSKQYSNKETNIINSCESSIDDVFDYKKCEESPKCATSSSPEVSSTTSEEKNSGILLKITNYGGSRVTQVNDLNPLNRISCKYTEKKDYSSSNGNLPTRTLITKGAQKYIPPLKETIRDLKVKLPLPQQNLLKLKQLKLTKEALKKLNVDRASNTLRKEVPKKTKPKFEDVLKSIDEMQFQKNREKNKKGRKSIPKVVIKKNEHGSHYASTSSKIKFNPDLTGMKWQPWVFLERDNFIDKMALRKKTRAIFSYRKNTYVLAEKFHKYKSICNTKFIISQPKHRDSSSGQLKYTIRLKHDY